jgi:hypothetical protein
MMSSDLAKPRPDRGHVRQWTLPVGRATDGLFLVAAKLLWL